MLREIERDLDESLMIFFGKPTASMAKKVAFESKIRALEIIIKYLGKYRVGNIPLTSVEFSNEVLSLKSSHMKTLLFKWYKNLCSGNYDNYKLEVRKSEVANFGEMFRS